MKLSTLRRLTAAALIVAACGGGSKQTVANGNGTGPGAESPLPKKDVAEGPAPRKLTADTVITTASGATFTVAAGWTVLEAADRVVMTTPEADLTMTHVEVAAADRAAANRAAWAIVDPNFALKVAQDQELPGRDGWEAQGQTIYVTPQDERRAVGAFARRKGKIWYVLLFDGKVAAFDRRGAQLGATAESLKVPGLDKEDWSGKTANAFDAARQAQLDEWITASMATAKIPGVAIAIVQGGKVVMARGWGVRELGKKAKIDAKTLFMIGSTTKSLTTLMMARQVDAGVFAWDTLVTDRLPGFALGDEAVTKALTMRHTVCACTGMPRQDLEWIFEYADATPEDRMAMMKTMVPTTGFGETFQYSNLMVAAGGYAAARGKATKQKLGPTYDKAMQDLVFGPLGMKATTFDFKRVAKANHASSHGQDLKAVPAVLPLAIEEITVAVRPAGAGWSNADDMARYVLLELGKGKLDGKQLVTEANLLERRKPQIKITDEQSYGLGLFVGADHGVAVVDHGGNVAGFTSDLFFLPGHDVGVVVLTNLGAANAFRSATRRRILELLFDGKAEATDDLADSLARQQTEIDELWTRIQADPDAAWFDPLQGAWTTAGLGAIELRRDKGVAVLDAGEWKVAVSKKTGQDGTIALIATGAPWGGIELVPREQDGKTVLILDAGQHLYTFERAKK